MMRNIIRERMDHGTWPVGSAEGVARGPGPGAAAGRGVVLLARMVGGGVGRGRGVRCSVPGVDVRWVRAGPPRRTGGPGAAHAVAGRWRSAAAATIAAVAVAAAAPRAGPDDGARATQRR